MQLDRTDDGPSARDQAALVRSLRAGGWLSLYTATVSSVYALFTWDEPHRAVWLAIAAVTVVLSLVVLRVPLERLVVSRHASTTLIAYSLVLLALTALALSYDGGAHSPAVVILFLPLAYAAISYPPVPALVVCAGVLGLYIGLAIATPVRFSSGFIFTAYLVAAAALCWSQVRGHLRQQEELARLSRTDYLTGALNRRGLDQRLEAELAAARRSGEPVSLAALDLDGFKAVNDRQGHAAGDELLRWTTAVAERELRESDDFGRVGGDEFAIVLPGLDSAGAAPVVERLREALAERIGLSIGIASFPDDGDDAGALHRVADEALYAEKLSGASSASPAP